MIRVSGLIVEPWRGRLVSQDLHLIEHFRQALCSDRGESDYIIAQENDYSVYYVPFERVNSDARLVLVGIRPGPTQAKCARTRARQLIRDRSEDLKALREIKRSCAFLGMRARINQIPTSLVPNAAFKAGKYFNGPFEAILNVAILRRQFEENFLPSVARVNKRALYVGMGPVVDEALGWCADRGVIKAEQVLGYFPHASASSGSQFNYFLRKKCLSDLKLGDPVRDRAMNLDAAYNRIKANLERLFPG